MTRKIGSHFSLHQKAYRKVGFWAAGLIFVIGMPFSAAHGAEVVHTNDHSLLPTVVHVDPVMINQLTAAEDRDHEKEASRETVSSGRTLAVSVTFPDETKLALKDKDDLKKTMALLKEAVTEELINGDYAQTTKPRIVLKEAGAQAQGLAHAQAEQPSINPGKYQVLDFKVDETYKKSTDLVEKSAVLEPDIAAQYILDGRVIESSHTVEIGEKLADIMETTGLSKARLKALNPDKDLSKLSDGMILATERTESLVPTETTLSYEGEVYEPYEVEFVDDPTMMVGQYKVTQQGVYGISQVKENLYFSGQRLTGTKVLAKDVVKEPVKAVIQRGTAKEEIIQWPMEGTMTSLFGERTWEDGSSEFHRGLDVANASGMPVGAALGGRVIFAGEMGTYGNVVFIDHGNGLETRYAHLSEVQVSEGEYVDQLECVGLCGSTGNSTGPHLHFETIYHGELIDPLRFLPE